MAHMDITEIAVTRTVIEAAAGPPRRHSLLRRIESLLGLLVEIPAGGSPGAVIDAIERSGAHVRALEIAQEGDRRSVAADVELRDVEAPDVVVAVGEVDGVLEVRWNE